MWQELHTTRASTKSRNECSSIPENRKTKNLIRSEGSTKRKGTNAKEKRNIRKNKIKSVPLQPKLPFSIVLQKQKL